MRTWLAAILFAMPVVAQAQTACDGLLSAVGAKATATATLDDGCAFDGVTAGLPIHQILSLAHLDLRHIGPARLGDGATPPPAARVEARGIRIVPIVANPLTSYILSVSARPFDVVLDYRSEPDGTVRIAEASLHGRSLGDITLSAVLAPTDPREAAAPWSQGGAVRSLRLHVDNKGFVESLVVPKLAATLDLDKAADPAAMVEAAKARVATILGVILGETAPAGLAALRAFVADFPHPDKVLDLTLDLPVPVGLATFGAIIDGRLSPAEALPSGSVAATYRH